MTEKEKREPVFEEYVRIKAISDHVSYDLTDASVILNYRNGIYYGVNPVAARTWQLIQEPISMGEVREAILEEFQADRPECEHEMDLFIRDLDSRSLLEIQE